VRKPCSPKTSLVAHATNTGSPTDGLTRVKDNVLYGYSDDFLARVGTG
jgi:hypothetical protein